MFVSIFLFFFARERNLDGYFQYSCFVHEWLLVVPIETAVDGSEFVTSTSSLLVYLNVYIALCRWVSFWLPSLRDVAFLYEPGVRAA